MNREDTHDQPLYFWLTALYAALLPIKLSLAYSVLAVISILFIKDSLATRRAPEFPRTLWLPFCVLVLLMLVLSVFGLDVGRSLSKTTSFALFGFSAVIVARGCRFGSIWKILLALVLGQSMAAFYSIFEAGYPQTFARVFLGAVTESGQLALSTVIGVSLALWFREKYKYQHSLRVELIYQLMGFLITLLCLVVGFGSKIVSALSLHTFAGWLLLFLVVVIGVAIFKREGELPALKFKLALYSLIVPIMISALLLNLKRGPLVATFISLAILFSFYLPKLVVPLSAITTAALLGIAPIRERLADSFDHFYIAGGRASIWDIGVELAMRFPLGIGYENSSFLRKFDRLIPENLKHFHNNFLNIAVELGWLGLAVMLWWLVATIGFAYAVYKSKSELALIALGIGAALLSWQFAGLVEYNIGDSEVRLIALLLIGVLAATQHNSESRAEQQPENPI